jgi:hypothetical protein
LSFAANNNTVEVWSAMITCSPIMIGDLMSGIDRVPYVANREVLTWEKVTQSGKPMTHAGGLEVIQNSEPVIQVMFNSKGRLDSKAAKPRVLQNHFPYGLMQHMAAHPHAKPLQMRSSIFKAAYNREKYPCSRVNYEGVANLSEKSIDVCTKMVRRST